MTVKAWMTFGGLAAALLMTGAVAATATFASAGGQAEPPPPGKAVYEKYCGDCHNDPVGTKSPSLESLMQRNRQNLQAALSSGKMAEQGAQVPSGEMFQLLDYLAVKTPLTDEWLSNRCPANGRAVAATPATLTYQGVDLNNSRHMDAKRAGLTGAQLANLEVAWVFGFPQTTDMRAGPVVVGSTIFQAAVLGYVVALDTKTGCVKWAYKSPNLLRTSLTYGKVAGKNALVFGDLSGMVHAVDAATGRRIWMVDGRHEPGGFLTGSPLIWQDRVIVPVSANDVARAQNPRFECCTTHGAVVALNAANGRRLWVAHATEPAKLTGKTSSVGTRLWGPSGAIVWSSPAIDPKAGVLYVGTGENTSLPATKTSDAIWAIDLRTGKDRWFFQALERDVWNMSCGRGPNCPDAAESVLRDHDFGAGPVLAQVDGRTVIMGGQKSGDVWGLSADGKQVWHQRFGRGSALGGVHWGMATNGKVLFVPIAGGGSEGMKALDVATGRILWETAATCATGPAPAAPAPVAPPAPGAPARAGVPGRGGGCRAGLSAAPLSIDNAVIAATLSGQIVVFDAATGRQTALYNTNAPFPTINRVEGKGGSVDAQSIGAGDGMLFVGSGYSQFGQTAGNVLIAYRPKR